MEKLLMLGTSLASREMVEYARSQGMRTVVTDYLPPERSTAKLVADEWWMINTGDLDALEERCRSEGVTSVVCGVSEFNLEVVMELSRRLILSWLDNPQRVVCTNDEHLEKRHAAQLSEAADFCDCWRCNSLEGKQGCLRRGLSRSSSGCSSRIMVALCWIRRSMRSRCSVEPSKRAELGLS